MMLIANPLLLNEIDEEIKTRKRRIKTKTTQT